MKNNDIPRLSPYSLGERRIYITKYSLKFSHINCIQKINVVQSINITSEKRKKVNE